ncbi:phage tail sheath family protein [Streptomyces murinus]|uniref:phage tail sheath family protein n=1 Tax=Streptomyces murinus TaxID=33900 RepID=UPI0037F8187C
MTTPLAPGVYIKEVPSGVRSVVGAGTSTPAFFGYTAQNDNYGPTLVRSWAEFTKNFFPTSSGYSEEVGRVYQEALELANELEDANKYAKSEIDNRRLEANSTTLKKFSARLTRLERRLGYPSSAVSELQKKTDEVIAKIDTGDRKEPDKQNAAVASAVKNFYKYVSNGYGDEGDPKSIASDIASIRALADTVSEVLEITKEHTKDAYSEAEKRIKQRGLEEHLERITPSVREKCNLNLKDLQNLIEAKRSAFVYQEKGGFLAEAVMGFFSNGGASCYIVPLSSEAEPGDALKGDEDKKTGLRGLETVGDVSMVAVPDMHILAPDMSLASEVVNHCAKMGDRVALIDPLPDLTASGMESFRQGLPVGSHKEFATLYYPWVIVPGVEGEKRAVPPSGHICGVWAATDASRGVFKAPANVSLSYAIDLATALSDDEQGGLNRLGVNCLRSFPGRPLLVWGARTLADESDRDWKYLNVRRLVCFLADSIKQSTSWAVFEPNDERLWSTLRFSVSAFLRDQWRQGALQGATPEEAFHVVCDKSNNPQDSIDLGEVHCDIYVAPVRPAEFVHFTIQQIAGQTA